MPLHIKGLDFVKVKKLRTFSLKLSGALIQKGLTAFFVEFLIKQTGHYIKFFGME
jgi:hypothetical protein